MNTISGKYSAHLSLIESALIVTFERKEFLKPLMEKLALMKISRVYVAIDGPKTRTENSPQDEIERLAVNVAKELGLQFIVWKREANLGLALSMISAIDWFFLHERIGMILEDDILVSKSFLNFASKALNEYADNSKVLLVSATRPESFEANQRLGWTHYPMIWGWATTSDKWKVCKEMILDPKPVFGAIRNSRVAFYWSLALRRISSGRLDSWAVILASQMRSGNFFCVIPPVNMASNIGFGELATHTKVISRGMNANRGDWNGEFEVVSDMNIEKEAIDGDSRIERFNYRVSRYVSVSFFASFVLDPLRFKRKNKLHLVNRWSKITIPGISD